MPTPTPKKRNRWAVQDGQPVVLQERDLDILQFIFELGYVTSSLIGAYYFEGAKPRTVSKRLKNLRNRPNEYLAAPLQQKETNHAANYSNLIYEITEKGIDTLIRHDRITMEQARWRSLIVTHKYREFWHDVNTANVVGSIRLALKAHPTYRFVSPFEIIARMQHVAGRSPLTLSLPSTSKRRHIIPDYLFGIARPGKTLKEYIQFFWHEHDQGTEPLRRKIASASSFEVKLADLDEMLSLGLYEKQLGLPKDSLYVSTTTLSAGHLAGVMSCSRELPFKRRFIFKAVAQNDYRRVPSPIPDALAKWQREGGTLFSMAEEA